MTHDQYKAMVDSIEGESKVLQYFGNIMHNLATTDAFAEVSSTALKSTISNLPELA